MLALHFISVCMGLLGYYNYGQRWICSAQERVCICNFWKWNIKLVTTYFSSNPQKVWTEDMSKIIILILWPVSSPCSASKFWLLFICAYFKTRNVRVHLNFANFARSLNSWNFCATNIFLPNIAPIPRVDTREMFMPLNIAECWFAKC